MKNVKLAAALGCLSLSAAANAGVTSTWTLASDYDFRGITQSAQDPAVQASVDYAHDSGWYLGGWASNVDFCADANSGCLDAYYEVDLYTGFSGSTGEDGHACYSFGDYWDDLDRAGTGREYVDYSLGA